MKFLKLLAIVIICFVVFSALSYLSSVGIASSTIFGIVILAILAWIIFSIVKHYLNRSRFPGGAKGAALQGIWVLEKNFRFDPVLKKYEVIPVEPKKNYFEFKGSNFRSGDFDEKHEQLPAEYSPFLVEGDNLIIESEFFKNGNWKWAIKKDRLELNAEMAEPKNSKSQFIFYKKNWR
jgi:hypothetical protein